MASTGCNCDTEPPMELKEQAPVTTLARRLATAAHVSGLAIRLAHASGAGGAFARMAPQGCGGARRGALPAGFRSIAPAGQSDDLRRRNRDRSLPGPAPVQPGPPSCGGPVAQFPARGCRQTQPVGRPRTMRTGAAPHRRSRGTFRPHVGTLGLFAPAPAAPPSSAHRRLAALDAPCQLHERDGSWRPAANRLALPP